MCSEQGAGKGRQGRLRSTRAGGSAAAAADLPFSHTDRAARALLLVLRGPREAGLRPERADENQPRRLRACNPLRGCRKNSRPWVRRWISGPAPATKAACRQRCVRARSGPKPPCAPPASPATTREACCRLRWCRAVAGPRHRRPCRRRRSPPAGTLLHRPLHPPAAGIPKFFRWLSERYPLINQPGGATVVPIIGALWQAAPGPALVGVDG